MRFAEELNYTLEDAQYFYDEFRHKQWLEIKDTDSFQLDHSVKLTVQIMTLSIVQSSGVVQLTWITRPTGKYHPLYGKRFRPLSPCRVRVLLSLLLRQALA